MGITAGAPFQFESGVVNGIDVVKMTSTISVVVWTDSTGNDALARVIQDDETMGTEFVIDGGPATTDGAIAVARLTDTKGVFFWSGIGGGFLFQVFTLSGTTISMPGSSLPLSPDGGPGGGNDFTLVGVSSTAVIAAYGDNNTGRARYITESSNVLTDESAVEYDASDVSHLDILALTSTKAIVSYQDAGATDGKACILSISGTTISAGTAVQLDTTDNVSSTALAPISATQSLVAYTNSTDTDIKAVVLSISGTSITVNTAIVVESASTGSVSLAAFNTVSFVICYNDTTSTDSMMFQLTVSGTTVKTTGSEVQFDTGQQTVAQAVAFSSTKAINVYNNSGDAVIITIGAFTGYDLIVSAGGLAKHAMAVSADGENLFFALEEDGTTNQIILKATRAAAPTVTIAYEPFTGTAGNVEPTGDNDIVIFNGNFGTDVGVIKHAIAAVTNTDISPSSIAAKVIAPVRVDPSDITHLIGVNVDDQDAIESDDTGASWATLNATLGQTVVAMDIIWLGQYFLFGVFFGGNDGADENLEYSPNEFSSLREDSSAALKSVGAITGIDIISGNS